MAIGEIFAGVSAVSSIFGGISGASNARKNEKAARKAAKEAKKAAKDRARKINRYNNQKFEDDKQNFLDNRQFNYDQAMKAYDYQNQVQALEYNTQMRAYAKDQENYRNALQFNKIGERQAYLREQNVMRDITDEQSFDRMDVYIEGLKKESAARTSAAGKSGDVAVQMALAEKGRQLAVMDASFNGAVRQHNINMFDIAINKLGADMRAEAATMLKPSKPIALIKPEMTPLPIFTKPMEVEPEYVSQYVPSSDTLGSILGGISGAAGALSGIDFTNSSATTPAPKTPQTFGNAYDFSSPGAFTPMSFFQR